jgi:hypothetical protein
VKSGRPPAPNVSEARFRTTLLGAGKTATGIVVPPEIVASLGRGKRAPVVVTIGTHTYRSTIAVMGAQFMIGVSADNRAKAGVAAGDEVDIRLELDTEPRKVAVPQDFAKALGGHPAAKRFFEGLSYSQQQWHVLSIEGAKTTETRHRRIDKSMALLRDGKAR